MTKDEMVTAIASEVGLEDIDSYNEKTFVEGWIYQGTLDLLTRTRCIVRCVQLRVTANQGQYVLDQGILSLVDVEDGARHRAARSEDVLATDPGFVLIRSDLLRIEPTPSEDGKVQVWAVLKPQKMSAGTDSIKQEQFGAIPEEYHDAVVTYGLWKAGTYSDDASSQMGERYRILYEGENGQGGRLGQIRMLINKKGTARPSRRQVRLAGTSPSGSYTG